MYRPGLRWTHRDPLRGRPNACINIERRERGTKWPSLFGHRWQDKLDINVLYFLVVGSRERQLLVLLQDLAKQWIMPVARLVRLVDRHGKP